MGSKQQAWYDSDACPRWCEGDHDPKAHLDDQVHEAGRIIAVRVPFGDGGSISTDMSVVVSRRVGESATWLTIADGEGAQVSIAVQYARPLLDAVVEVIAELDGAGER